MGTTGLLLVAIPVLLVVAPRLYRWLRLRRAAPAPAAELPRVDVTETSPSIATDVSVSLQDHVAGHIQRPDTPFDAIDVPRNAEPLTTAFTATWVEPLYFGPEQPEAERFAATRLGQADDAIVRQLLGDDGWRARIAGAYLAALGRRESFTAQIGGLLLRSDVCYAGGGYCVALAAFGTDEARSYLEQYLDYYLTRRDLEFDQDHAMAALAYLDRVDGSDVLSRYLGRWDAFRQERGRWNLPRAIEQFESRMRALERLRAAALER